MSNKAVINDARGLAQIIRTGWYHEVNMKSPRCHAWRALSREAGLKPDTPSRRGFASRARELTGDDQVLTSPLEALLSVIEVMTREVDRPTKRALDEVRIEPTCRRLMTVPGVGPRTTLAFRATVNQPCRFRRPRDVSAYLGLAPRRYHSGETDMQGHISGCGDELTRTALYEAAHTLPVRSIKWSTLRTRGMQIAERRGLATSTRRSYPQTGSNPAPYVE